MSRLIDADAITSSNELAKKIVSYNLTPYLKVDDLLEFVDNLPTIEAVPVAHGKWKPKYGSEDDVYWYCSKCRKEVLYDIHGYQEITDFCPYCGARMDGAE